MEMCIRDSTTAARGCAVKVACLIEDQLGCWIKAVRSIHEPVEVVDDPPYPACPAWPQTEDATVQFVAEAIICRAIESAGAVED